MSRAMTDTDKLKPCPFCGSQASLKIDSDHHGEFFELGCIVATCPGHWAYYTESVEDTPVESAIAAWNTRTQEDAG